MYRSKEEENATDDPSMAPHIPFQIITEILAKLPVKSLLKFQVVCKSWCFLISTTWFVNKHLSSNTTATKRVILMSTKGIRSLALHDSKLVEESSPIELQIENAASNDDPFKRLWIHGYSNGLVCIQAYTSYVSHPNMIFLWNPCTTDSKILPYMPTVDIRTRYIFCCGFGYDYSSDDYKVLLVLRPGKSWMYTSRTSSWKRIQDFPDYSVSIDDLSATLVNGALHWMAMPKSKNGRIISFDLTTDTYMDVPEPDFHGTDVRRIGIGASSTGCLCLLVYNFAGRPSYYDFWVMKKYGVRESWTKSFKIPNIVDGEVVRPTRPVTWFSEKWTIIFSRYGNLATYIANENTIAYQPDDIATSWKILGDDFVESLVSPNACSSCEADKIGRVKINLGRTRRVVVDV